MILFTVSDEGDEGGHASEQLTLPVLAVSCLARALVYSRLSPFQLFIQLWYI